MQGDKTIAVAPLKVAIVGFGKMGQTRKRALEKTGAGEVIMILGNGADPVPPELKVKTLEEITKSAEVEAVFCCSINSRNFGITKAALLGGKHVFCEKPPALNASEVQELIEIEKATGLVLMYGFNHRHHGGVQKMKEVVDSQALGRILWMRGRYGKSVDSDFLGTWRANPELSGGGILIDQGIHMLDMMMHLAGDFDEVQGMVSNVFWDTPGIEDNVFLNLRNSRTGVVASLHSTMVQWRHLFSFEVFLERGYMVLNGIKTSSDTYGSEELIVNRNSAGIPVAKWETEESYTWLADESWDIEVLGFQSWVRSKTPGQFLGDSESAFRVMRIIEKVYQTGSFKSNRLFRSVQIPKSSSQW